LSLPPMVVMLSKFLSLLTTTVYPSRKPQSTPELRRASNPVPAKEANVSMILISYYCSADALRMELLNSCRFFKLEQTTN
jgi:hypothetical protein